MRTKLLIMINNKIFLKQFKFGYYTDYINIKQRKNLFFKSESDFLLHAHMIGKNRSKEVELINFCRFQH